MLAPQYIQFIAASVVTTAVYNFYKHPWIQTKWRLCAVATVNSNTLAVITLKVTYNCQ